MKVTKDMVDCMNINITNLSDIIIKNIFSLSDKEFRIYKSLQFSKCDRYKNIKLMNLKSDPLSFEVHTS